MKTEAAAVLHIAGLPAEGHVRPLLTVLALGREARVVAATPLCLTTMFSSQYCVSSMVNQHYPNHD